jgi:uncharacterized protein YjbJ (UPF0337 family)
MTIQDKLTGRFKQAAGDLTGDKALRDEGVREERKAEARRELHEAEQRVQHLRDEIARLEYSSSGERASPNSAGEHPPATGQLHHAQTDVEP